MPAPVEDHSTLAEDLASQHISVVEDTEHHAAQEPEPSPGLRDSKGWDGKARVDRTAVITNPEALSDPEYSDDENVAPGEELPADEGMGLPLAWPKVV